MSRARSLSGAALLILAATLSLGATLSAGAAEQGSVADPDDLMQGMTVLNNMLAGGPTYQPVMGARTRDKWRVYATLTETPDRSRRADLHLILRGVPIDSLKSIDFEIDDDEEHIAIPSEGLTVRQVSACQRTAAITIKDQADLIGDLGAADEATVSYGGDPEERRYRLHDFELDELDRIAGLLEAKTLPRPARASSPYVDGGEPVSAGAGGVTNPVIIPASKVQPAYPESARLKKHGGEIVLQAVIRKDGTVDDLETIGSTGDCDMEQSAIAAVKKWRYRPGTLRGKPVDVYFTVVVTFTLEPRGAKY